MNPQFVPDDAETLFTLPLDPNSFTLIGTIPNQFPTGITLFITNEDPKNTVMAQVIITRHRTANAANVYNRTMYIPPKQMAKLTNFVNIAGLNVFVKTSGTKSTAVIIHTDTLDNGRTIYNATPTVINQDQTIVAMPPPVLGTSNSTDTQLMVLYGRLKEAFSFIEQLNTQSSNNYTNLNNKIGTLSLLIQELANQIQSGTPAATSSSSSTSSEVSGITTAQSIFDGISSGLITENYTKFGLINKINLIFTNFSNGNMDPFTIPLLYTFSQNPYVSSNINGMPITVAPDSITFYPTNPDTLYNGLVIVEL